MSNFLFKVCSHFVNDNYYQLALTLRPIVTIIVTNRGDKTCIQRNFQLVFIY
jgi:hypothetical protein